MTPQERKNFESIRDNVHGEPMTQVEAMKLALEALEMVKANADDWQQRTGKEIKGWMQPVNNSITALRQAIEQAQKPEHIEKLEELGWSSEAINKANTPQHKQEPVGRFSKFADGVWKEVTATSAGQPLYAAPPQLQPLTLNQLREHWQVAKVLDMTDAEIDFADYVLIARDVEALHEIKEKNT